MDAKEVMVLITGAHKAYALHMVSSQNKTKVATTATTTEDFA